MVFLLPWTLLTHLNNKSTYAHLLFADFSSAFNTVISAKLGNKLGDLGTNTSPLLDSGLSD